LFSNEHFAQGSVMVDANKIIAVLHKKYPDPKIALRFSNPLELLVATILSAQCTDARVNEVTKTLFKKYRSAQDYAQAELHAFEEEIRSTGFYKNKAKAIINCCRKLVADFHGMVPDSLGALTTLPGVGRKTANMVLGNAYGQAVVAVDTHVLRVSNRLGLAHAGRADKVEEELMRQIPRSQWTAVGNALILHFPDTCTAKKPKCGACVLYAGCAWPDKSRYAGSPP
jgi:endonuclease-3